MATKRGKWFSVDLMLSTAEGHLDELQRRIHAFGEGNVYTVDVDREPKDGWRKIRIDTVEDAPEEEWLPELGNFAQNLRNALDHLVYAQSGKASGTAFPIETTQDGYLAVDKKGITKRDRVLHGVPDRHKAIIDALQPYKRPEADRGKDPLVQLAWLANFHKHREVHTTLVVISTPKVTVSPTNDDDPVDNLDFAMQLRDGDPIEPGTEVARFTFRPDPSIEVGVKTEIPYDVVFGARGLNVERLKEIQRYVIRIIERLKPRNAT